MKALGIRQPWAWLIVAGHKDVENRGWNTRFRGRFLIHAGKALDTEAYDWIRRENPNLAMPPLEEMARGGLVGSVDLIDCRTDVVSPWFSGPYGFVLAQPQELVFRALPGRLRFFSVADDFN